MLKLVSVIIPCFNAQKWVKEAIDSCLQQSYSRIEVIVIDDGSTDRSLEILKSYGDRITWVTGPNQGGNHARNKGFALAQGDYLQYLDADDYLLPETIERQVRGLEAAAADAVYGDWRYQCHRPDGTSHLEDLRVCGPKADFLESSLANDRWGFPGALLFTRAAVEGCGGWDESLRAAQDRDFFMAIAMSGAKFVYQPGCCAIYRRYGNVTVSTSCKLRWLENHVLVMEKAEKQLAQSGRLSPKYRQALAKAYFDMGKEYFYSDFPHLDFSKFSRYLRVLEKALTLFPKFKAANRTALYNCVQSLFGCRQAEIVSYFVSQAKVSLTQTIDLVKETFTAANSQLQPSRFGLTYTVETERKLDPARVRLLEALGAVVHQTGHTVYVQRPEELHRVYEVLRPLALVQVR